MPSTIPYNHPSLVLGNIADTGVLDLCNQIQSLNGQIDIAQDKLNSFIMMKRSLAMTMNELADMGIKMDELIQKQGQLDQSISSAAQAYLDTRMDAEEKIQNLKEQISKQPLGKSVESPIDFSQSKLITLPLATESIKMDSQYFSFGINMQDDVLANIEKFVKSTTENLGSKSNDITSAVSSQINSQVKNHSLAGTLIITASCTYSTVKMFDPLILDADKAVSAWNILQGDKGFIDTSALKTQAGGNKNTSSEKDTVSIPLITGACYGASFVGMIHILKTQSSKSGDIDEVKAQLENKLRLGGWIENATGGIGVNPEIVKDIKVALSTQNVSSHISVVTMGSIPSIASNKLTQTVNSIVSKDSADYTKIYDGIDSGVGSASSESEKAVERTRAINIEKIKMQTIMSGLGKIDYEANKSFDVNSLIDAFENFVKDNNPNKGIPIGFYLKQVSKQDIEELWINKYYPANVTSNKTN